jgi:hypothetical protein
MAEILPIAGGILCGVLIGLIRPRLQLAVGASIAVVLGAVATIVSGEYLIGWEYLLIDIPLVAGSEIVGHLTVRRMRGIAIPPRAK